MASRQSATRRRWRRGTGRRPGGEVRPPLGRVEKILQAGSLTRDSTSPGRRSLRGHLRRVSATHTAIFDGSALLTRPSATGQRIPDRHLRRIGGLYATEGPARVGETGAGPSGGADARRQSVTTALSTSTLAAERAGP